MRLARTLLLANFYKDGKPDAIRKMSQETLAEMVGTTRSRVSFFMNKFRRLGLIDYRGNGTDLRTNASLLEMMLRESACTEIAPSLDRATPSRSADGRLMDERADRCL